MTWSIDGVGGYRTAAAVVLLFLTVGASEIVAQDIPIGVTFICSGEHIYVDSCNMRDTSDTSTCMVAHPDHLTPNGTSKNEFLTRSALKKLLPTCEQPSAKQLAAAKARQQRQQDIYNANVQKTESQMNAPQPTQEDILKALHPTPKDPDERQMDRCITAGRPPSSCTGNALLGGFSKMVTSVLPSVPDPGTATAGPVMAGVFVGSDNWRLDFVDGGVLVNCAFLSPNQETYSVRFVGGRTELIVNTRPKPLVLTVHPDETITGPGPVTIEGVVATGYHQPTPAGAMYKDAAGNYYDSQKNKLQTTAGYSTFSSRTATCPALNLTTKGASVGIQTMQTDLLKSMMGGDKGPPTPPGVRLHGIYAASSGFSAQFFPESVILGCGPDAARAYPYQVVSGPSGGTVKIDAQDHPLTLALRADNTLDPGATDAYQVHGRAIIGQNPNGDNTYMPRERTCNLALLSPSKTIPEAGGTAVATNNLAVMNGLRNNQGTPAAGQMLPGNAVLSIISGLASPQGAPNPLANHPLILLRYSYGDSLARAGVSVPAGVSPFKFAGNACGTHSPDCVKISQAIQASAASAVRADATGKGTLPAVPPGMYYLMVSAIYNQKQLIWGQPVQVHAGQNTITLDESNATPLN
jgi:hypothetical protein